MFDFFKKKETTEKQTNEPTTEQANESKKTWSMAFGAFKQTISKTTETLVDDVVNVVDDNEELSEYLLDDMEDLLIKADIGLETAVELVDKLREKKNLKTSQIKEYLETEFAKILNETETSCFNFIPDTLNIYLVTGVNGAGKTTFIGKLANRFRIEGQKVLLAAGDTFRAAAEEQLDIWAKRANVDIVRKDGVDASSVVFDAIKKAKDDNYNVLIIDTAGRLQNKFNLMEELRKIKSVIDKNASEYLRESLLVLDANTGQNGLSQAKIFSEAVNLSGVILTKLDGSAKGGIIIAIAKQLKLPVKMIGVGEKIEDIKDFDPNIFIKALFAKK